MLFQTYLWKPWKLVQAPNRLLEWCEQPTGIFERFGNETWFWCHGGLVQSQTKWFSEKWWRRTYWQFLEALQSKFCKMLFQTFNWKPWKFCQVPKGYWNDINNRKEYLKDLASTLGFKTMQEWYSLTCKDFQKTTEQACSGFMMTLSSSSWGYVSWIQLETMEILEHSKNRLGRWEQSSAIFWRCRKIARKNKRNLGAELPFTLYIVTKLVLSLQLGDHFKKHFKQLIQHLTGIFLQQVKDNNIWRNWWKKYFVSKASRSWQQWNGNFGKLQTSRSSLPKIKEKSRTRHLYPFFEVGFWISRNSTWKDKYTEETWEDRQNVTKRKKNFANNMESL